MFVTCLFAILDPATGHIVLANAGHNLPYVRTEDGVIEMRATGMPSGSWPGSSYDETEGDIAPGQQRPALLRRPGRGPRPTPARCSASRACARRWRIDDAGSELLDRLLETLHGFTGPDWEQEDDITLVTLRRAAGVADDDGRHRLDRSLTAFSLPGTKATSVWRWTGWRPPIADLGLSPAVSNASRPPSARRR